MLYMVVERYKPSAAPRIYERFRDRGRMLPAGLEYVSSWVTLDFAVCYQLMQTHDPVLFELWTAAWNDLVEFDIVPVRSSSEAAQVAAAG